MAENFSELAKIINLYIQEAKRSKNWTNSMKSKQKASE